MTFFLLIHLHLLCSDTDNQQAIATPETERTISRAAQEVVPLIIGFSLPGFLLIAFSGIQPSLLDPVIWPAWGTLVFLIGTIFIRPTGVLGVVASLGIPAHIAVAMPITLVLTDSPDSPTPMVWIVIGSLLMVIASFLFVWTNVLFVRIGQGTLSPENPTTALVIEGPFKYVRNPMIAGVVLFMAGLAIANTSLRLTYYFLWFFAVHTAYLKFEEEPGLVKRFGQEYELYKGSVWRWIPKLSPYTPVPTPN